VAPFAFMCPKSWASGKDYLLWVLNIGVLE
jgi:hypothetical protein